MKNEKTLVKGVGYTTIYKSDISSKKYELSTQGTMLKKTVTSHSGRQELLYKRVESLAEIDDVEFRSERWERVDGGTTYKYIVLEQCNAEGKHTGYIKVVPKSKANVSGFFHDKVEAKKSDCMYYKRRTGK